MAQQGPTTPVWFTTPPNNPGGYADQIALQRQQAIADALMQQSMQPMGADLPQNLRVVPRLGIGNGLVKLGQALAAGYMQKQVMQKQAELWNRNAQSWGQLFNDGSGGASTGGAQPAQQQAPQSAPQPGDDGQDTTPAPQQQQQAASMPPTTGDFARYDRGQGPAPQQLGAALAASGPQEQLPQPDDAVDQHPPTTPGGLQVSNSPSPGPSGVPGPHYSSRGALAMPGMDSRQAMLAFQIDPQTYIKSPIARADNRTDLTKTLLSVGVDPQSDIGRQVVGAWLRKQTYIAPENARPGSWSIYPDGHKSWNPDIPKGGVPAYDQGGNFIGAMPMAGAAGVTQLQNAAEATGKTSGTLYPSINPSTGRETMVPGSAYLQQPGAPLGGPAGTPGAGGVDPGRFSGYQAPNAQPPVSKLGPGEGDLGTAGAARMNDLQRQVADSQTRANVLDNILDLSRQGVATGPTAEWKNKLLGAFSDNPIGPKLASIVGADPRSDVARFTEIKKFMAQNAQRSWQAAGGTGTDAQLEQQINANVNAGMFPAAVRDVALWSKGGELALQAKALAQQQWAGRSGNAPLNQSAFETAWRGMFDPRVYQLSAIRQFDPARLADFTKTMSATDRAALADKYTYAKRQGWIPQ
ncbi:hypothetical protein [Roseateles saccharophilus]|uniref:Uncharacterized protein n=1 Tax=Roseateles saccharophilus TaxID=304 RepID=A0A4R3ULF0_ROSSA|nr:hypothetical protein [Roseateles saccharophilus]TCU91290.1 hypothetical protein EV671_10265 [Roseateles saccharophilus]